MSVKKGNYKGKWKDEEQVRKQEMREGIITQRVKDNEMRKKIGESQ